MPADESLKLPKNLRERDRRTERMLVHLFLGACLLMVIVVFLVFSSLVAATAPPPAAIVAYRSVLMWSLVVVMYAFYLLIRLVRRTREDVSRRTFVDELTGVANFRYLNHRLAEECDRTRRYGEPTSVLFMDLDHFKEVNDRHGHQVGNAVLRGVAIAMKQQVRSSDVLGRMGGDEFLVLMPATDQADALVLAERLRNTVEGYCLNLARRGMIDFVRVSVGIAVCPAHGDSVETIIRAADHAVYRVKEHGGNETCVAAEEAATSEATGQSQRAAGMGWGSRAALDAESP